jgi:chromosome segregation ATPase
MNEALNKRSEEGIKEMISENVELKSDKLKLQKDNQGMKRTIRDLEKRLKDRQAGKDSANQYGETDDEAATEEEIVFLRERIETYEVEMERLRSEVFAGENEKRRLAEIVRSMGESRPAGSETGAREERVSCIICCRLVKLTWDRICGKTCLMPRRLRASKPMRKTDGFVMRFYA